jgi:hypothetical protein
LSGSERRQKYDTVDWGYSLGDEAVNGLLGVLVNLLEKKYRRCGDASDADAWRREGRVLRKWEES